MERTPDGGPRIPDFLVLGLGNPGPRYANTRHNFGFLLVDALVRSQGSALAPGPGPCRSGTLRVGPAEGMVVKPATYMNRSGAAARGILDRFEGFPLSRMLVAYDDLDLPLGRIRFRRGGGEGGHNGVRSLVEELGTRDFPRLRLGIGRPGLDETDDVIGHVLEPFAEEEWESVREVIARGAEGVRVFIEGGIEEAMNRFNAA